MADPREVDAISRPPIHSQLHYALADRFGVAEGAGRDSREPRLDPRTRLPVLQTSQPLYKRPASVGCLVVMKLHGDCNL